MRTWKLAAAIGSVLAVGVVLAGCDSGSGSATPDTRRTTTTTTRPKVTGVEVDLLVSGDRIAAVKGTKGTCNIPRFGAPNYDFAGADYPDLGPSGSLMVVGPVIVGETVGVPASAGVTIGDVGLVTPSSGAGITLSKNMRVVTIDAELTGGPGGAEDINLNSPDNSLHGRLTGTIRCTTD
jgi:hypothetical protein